ncbi:hypothetical protein D9M70_534870 [compost metagenome]
MRNLHALGRFRQIADLDIADRDIENFVLTLDEEVVVVGNVGVEVGLGTFHREHADHAGLGELVQRIVDGCERNRHPGHDSLLVQFLDGQVTVTLGKDQIGEGNALTGRTQA